MYLPMHSSYTSERLSLLTFSTSLAGMLCLSLADLLPWSAFALLAAFHLIIWKWFQDRILSNYILATILTAGIFGIEAFRVFLVGREAILPALRDMILVLALTRLVMKKTAREIYQIVGIAFAECLFATILTTSPLFLIGVGCMVCLVPMTLSCLDAFTFSEEESIKEERTFHWVAIWSGIVLAACLIFYIIPRPSSMIVRHSLAYHDQKVFIDEIDLFQGHAVEKDDTIVMRIVWSSGKVPADFYLAGARLEGISPNGFSKQETRGTGATGAWGSTDRITIYSTLLRAENVFFPYWLKDISPKSCHMRGSNLYWFGEIPPVYDVWVNRSPSRGYPCSIELPDGLISVGDLGVKVAGQGDITTKVRRIAHFLQTTHTYSLDAPNVPQGASPINWFVFKNRKGDCEHFAAALATMIRGCGIPARVVTGFHVSEYNTNGDYFIVRASDAHAWVEYWDGSWHTIDATPYQNLQPIRPFNILDELRFRWIRWVIQYSFDDQIHIASQIFTAGPRITRQVDTLVYLAVYLFAAGLALWAFIHVVKSRFLQPYVKVRRALCRKGMKINSNSTHEEDLRIVLEKLPPLAPHFEHYLSDYLAWRFGDRDMDIKKHTSEILDKIRTTP
jgi:hypothetical protein